MKLLMTPTSPYARKARIIALEKRIECEMCPVAVWEDDPQVLAVNPMRKVPVLILDSGEAVMDSRVICEYLDYLSGAPHFLPADSAARFAAKTREALVEGATDSALTLIMAGKSAPQMTPDPAWRKWLLGKAERTLDMLEKDVAMRDVVDVSDVACFCFLDFWLFRMPQTGWGDWRDSRPQLAEWFSQIGRRTHFMETDPRT